jgi:hypothetical protein
MKVGVRLNPQFSIDKPANSLRPRLIEQVHVADQSGFNAFSMGEHHDILGLHSLSHGFRIISVKHSWQLGFRFNAARVGIAQRLPAEPEQR